MSWRGFEKRVKSPTSATVFATTMKPDSARWRRSTSRAIVLDKSRRVIADAPILAVFAPANSWKVTPFQVDWEPRSGQTPAQREGDLLEISAYRTTASYDALNRMKRMQFPQDVEGKRRELRPAHNNAGGLEKVFLDDTLYVERIAYDAKGKRSLIAYGNGVMTRYACDPHTFGLKRLRSERYTKPNELTYHSSGVALQDFGYDYDLVGNILGISDRAPASGFLNNPEAASKTDSALAQLLIKGNALNRRFTYDPIYRLLAATGRECDRPPDGDPWDDQPRCTDLTKARAYDRAPPCQRIVHNVRPAQSTTQSRGTSALRLAHGRDGAVRGTADRMR